MLEIIEVKLQKLGKYAAEARTHSPADRRKTGAMRRGAAGVWAARIWPMAWMRRMGGGGVVARREGGRASCPHAASPTWTTTGGERRQENEAVTALGQPSVLIGRTAGDCKF